MNIFKEVLFYVLISKKTKIVIEIKEKALILYINI